MYISGFERACRKGGKEKLPERTRECNLSQKET